LGRNKKEHVVRKQIVASMGAGLALVLLSAGAVRADGFTNCTKQPQSAWRPTSAAEDIARKAGYEVRQTKLSGSCYEVYGVKGGKLFELFYNPVTLKVMETKAK